MTTSRYIKITNIEADGSFIQPTSKLFETLDSELDDLTFPITLKFEAVEMTEDEYANLPEFAGY